MATTLWIICAALNVAIAVLHIVVIVVGESAYRYFGAGEQMATMAAGGSPIPALVTSVITAAFFVFAAYNLAGADLIALPLTIWALAGIAAVYLLRGAVVFAVPFMSTPVSNFDLISSFVSLGIGLLHVAAFYLTFLAVRTA